MSFPFTLCKILACRHYFGYEIFPMMVKYVRHLHVARLQRNGSFPARWFTQSILEVLVSQNLAELEGGRPVKCKELEGCRQIEQTHVYLGGQVLTPALKVEVGIHPKTPFGWSNFEPGSLASKRIWDVNGVNVNCTEKKNKSLEWVTTSSFYSKKLLTATPE